MIRRPPRSTLFPYTTALPILVPLLGRGPEDARGYWQRKVPVGVSVTEVPGLPGQILSADRKSTRLNSSHANISYAVFCLKKKNNNLPHILDPYIASLTVSPDL